MNTMNTPTRDLKRSVIIKTSVVIFLMIQACTGSDPSPVQETGNITTIAGVAGDFDYDGDGGAATEANLGYITAITVDATGNIFFVDGAASVVRKIERSTGNISTIAGTFLGFNANDATPYAGDGGPATQAHLNVPFGVAVDFAGNVFIADAGNHVLRKVDASTGTITTIAGKPGIVGYSGDGGLATSSQLYNPYDVAVDLLGNIYIVDSQNHVIRKVAGDSGIISTIAGTLPIPSSGYSGDGGLATSATFSTLQGIAVDENGDVFVVDAGNHVVRKISSATGIISTIAGTGSQGYTGDGGLATSAKLYAPSKIAVDNSGDIYIADQGSHVVRKITVSTGIIKTLAGSGISGFSGDGGPAHQAKLTSPQGVAVDKSGNVFITDTGNSVIRAVKQN